jgi:hypothetical protein
MIVLVHLSGLNSGSPQFIRGAVVTKHEDFQLVLSPHPPADKSRANSKSPLKWTVMLFQST